MWVQLCAFACADGGLLFVVRPLTVGLCTCRAYMHIWRYRESCVSVGRLGDIRWAVVREGGREGCGGAGRYSVVEGGGIVGRCVVCSFWYVVSWYCVGYCV